MTVDELIKALSDFDGDMEVRISQPTHNYWREVLAQTIDEVDECCIGEDDNMIYDSVDDAIRNAYGANWVVIIRG